MGMKINKEQLLLEYELLNVRLKIERFIFTSSLIHYILTPSISVDIPFYKSVRTLKPGP